LAEKEIDGLLRAAVRADATDIHLKVGRSPTAHREAETAKAHRG